MSTIFSFAIMRVSFLSACDALLACKPTSESAKSPSSSFSVGMAEKVSHKIVIGLPGASFFAIVTRVSVSSKACSR